MSRPQNAVEAMLAKQYKEDADAWYEQWLRTEWLPAQRARRPRRKE